MQQAHLFIPARNREGTEQRIDFPAIADQKRGSTRLRLDAVSTAGLPVHYFVLHGPAEVEGDVLRFTAIPPRAGFPVNVTVVAWQYGRATEPKLRSAPPVERSFQILK